MVRFAEQAETSFLPDGKRLSLRHGPIDLVIEAEGKPTEITKAYQAARNIFPAILGNLVDELDYLRRPLTRKSHPPGGKIARRMYRAAVIFVEEDTLTPMIAVAGSVADYVLQQMTKNATFDRAYVNNGGDIALHLTPGTHFDIGVCNNPETGEILNKARIHAEDSIRGVATSGWRGRSHSLGIADAVTVLAASAADADVAATLIANAVNCHAPYAITRIPACDLNPDSDLAEHPVTVDVASLSDRDIQKALSNGHQKAKQFLSNGMIKAAHASLQGHSFSLFHEEQETCHMNQFTSKIQSHQELSYA